MQLRPLSKGILSIFFIASIVSSIASAQRPPTYNPCDVPTDPTCRGGGNPGPGHGGGHNPPPYPGHPGGPGHGGGHNPPSYPPSYPPTYPPSYPPPPTYPTYPTYPPAPTYPTYPNYGDNIERVIYINNSVTNKSLNLRDLAGLDSSYAGYRVVSVVANTAPNSSNRTIAQLVVDGVIFDSQTNPGYQIQLYPQSEVRLNRPASRVTLGISGSTVIYDIRIELSRY